MPVERTKMQAEYTELKYRCDECAEGYMEAGKIALMSNPPTYPHVCYPRVCDHCGHTKNIRGDRYPRLTIRYTPIPSEL
jgi:hypothetical protein